MFWNRNSLPKQLADKHHTAIIMHATGYIGHYMTSREPHIVKLQSTRPCSQGRMLHHNTADRPKTIPLSILLLPPPLLNPVKCTQLHLLTTLLVNITSQHIKRPRRKLRGGGGGRFAHQFAPPRNKDVDDDDAKSLVFVFFAYLWRSRIDFTLFARTNHTYTLFFFLVLLLFSVCSGSARFLRRTNSTAFYGGKQPCPQKYDDDRCGLVTLHCAD